MILMYAYVILLLGALSASAGDKIPRTRAEANAMIKKQKKDYKKFVAAMEHAKKEKLKEKEKKPAIRKPQGITSQGIRHECPWGVCDKDYRHPGSLERHIRNEHIIRPMRLLIAASEQVERDSVQGIRR